MKLRVILGGTIAPDPATVLVGRAGADDGETPTIRGVMVKFHKDRRRPSPLYRLRMHQF